MPFTNELLGNYSDTLATYFQRKPIPECLQGIFYNYQNLEAISMSSSGLIENTVGNTHVLMVWWKETEPHENTRCPESHVQAKDANNNNKKNV